ncbi:MAG: flagellar hook-associated protein FlgL [Chloroflexi bacterium]|nr:flagellar hook-associated protein FlgL [Chloroflexota bacterium]
MRVSEQSRQTNQLRYLQTASERLDRIQQQLATGRKIERASDDPSGAALALEHRASISFEDQMRRNLANGTAFMNMTETALEGVTEAFQRARELTVQASNDALSPNERTAIAREMDQLIQQLAQLGNTNFGGAYIFGGHQTRTPAFSVTGNPPTAVTYQGDTGQRMHRISREDAVAVNIPGSTAFGTVFADLIALRDNLDAGAPGAAIAPSISVIDDALDRVLQQRAEIGARVNRFASSLSRSEDTDTSLQQLRSDIEEIDLPATIVNLTAQEASMQAALGAIGRTSRLTLLDFLR